MQWHSHHLSYPAGQGPDGDGADKVDLDPQTKEAFNLLRESYSNNAHFAASLLQDPILQKQLRIIVHVLGPLHAEYARDLKCHKDGQTAVLYWHGDRAAGSYHRTITETLHLVNDGNVIELLGLLPQPSNPKGTLLRTDPRVQDDTKLLEQFFGFIVELSANRAWSQSFWTLSFPYALAGLYATSESDRHRTQMLCSRLATSIIKLEDLIAKSWPRNTRLEQLRNDLGTCDSQLVREIFMMGIPKQFSWKDEVLRELVFSMFGGPGTTKDALESAFNHLKDSVKSSKAKKYNLFTKFFYLLSSPYSQHCGLNQILPTMEDFRQLLEEGFKDDDVTSLGLFNYHQTSLSKDFPRPSALVGRFRAAGFYSNRVAAAASCFVLQEASNDFARLGQCWTGQYVNKTFKMVRYIQSSIVS